MKKLLIVLMLLSTLLLSACDESYPSITIHEGGGKDSRSISIGQPYKYDGFDVENIDGEKDLILHFIKGAEEVKQ